jgi:hypothetical protein
VQPAAHSPDDRWVTVPSVAVAVAVAVLFIAVVVGRVA